MLPFKFAIQFTPDEQTDLIVLNDKSGTHINHNGGMSCIDVSLASSNIALKINWNVYHDSLGSDHLPIRISVNASPEHEINSFSHSKNNSIYNKNILEAIHRAAERCIPKTNNKNRTRNAPYWNKQCKDAVNKRKRAEHKMRKTKDLQNCIEYRKSKAEAQKIIREEQANCWRNYCNNLTTDTKLSSVWHMAKKMTGADVNSIIPTVKDQGKLYETPYKKATVLAETYANTSSDNNYSVKLLNANENILKKN